MADVGIVQLLFLMIPAYVANMLPVFVRGITWNAPMDFGLSLGGVRLLGANKTWRGFLTGVGAAVLVTNALSFAYWPFSFAAWKWGVLAGAGALLGDAVESGFKRRQGLKSGQSWVPFDQVDYSIGALVAGSLVFFPGWQNAVIIVVLSAVGHVLVNHVAFFAGVRDGKW